ncbi:MAG: hypothetical protein ACRD3M_15455 [Thermoanaerobaculia bacterium]
MTLASDELSYLMDEAKATIAEAGKRYGGSSGGLILENEWTVTLDRGRYVIKDKSRNKILRYSSLEHADVQSAIDTIVRAFSK